MNILTKRRCSATRTTLGKLRKRRLKISTSRDVENGAAFAMAVSGDEAGPEAVAKDLEKRFPEDTIVKFTYLPIHRALLALNHKDSSAAIEHLQAAGPYDLAHPAVGMVSSESSMHHMLEGRPF
jgi:hypothetical protein